MTLHEAIIKLLIENNRSMTTQEIASELNENQWYQKKDKSLITDFQIHGRTINYSNLFNRNGQVVSLAQQNIKESELIKSTKNIFKINELYKRSEIHDQYGGNRQVGIANCQKYPFIFIFTGEAGEKYGYEDGWDTDNYYYYTGEGQSGDMTFTGGNKALLNHQTNDKKVFLFQNHAKGLWHFIDHLELVDWEYFPTPDKNSLIRQGIKFKFRSESAQSKNSKGKARKSVNYNKPNITERKGLVTSRVGQGWYRKALLDKWDKKCAVIGINEITLLIASHIIPWKDSNNQERLDPENGILLSPHLDALFDKHLISFDEKGNIILSSKLTKSEYYLLGINNNMKLREVTSGMKKYLKIHKQALL